MTSTKSKKTTQKTPAGKGRTILDLAEAYLGHLEKEGRSATTVFGYRMELKRAVEEIGEKATVKALTVGKVQAFFESDRVKKLRSGKPKNQRSIDKTRRVLRLALVWAEEQGWIERAPIPAKEKKAKKAKTAKKAS